ncbi:hypothetical protein ADEAN_000936000 [Angomonas deanei]|uniref:Uncharacterized protein n=1 Tax=Angomonas deanei TaxID=59799 RepID=A0A7G2CQR6_9TRYP|nr:hypothetical protein ADEAN_000936000 [Angomonas deanei]
MNGSIVRKVTRIRNIRVTLHRWKEKNIVSQTDVVDTLSTLIHGKKGEDYSFAYYHNALVDQDVPWAVVLSALSLS